MTVEELQEARTYLNDRTSESLTDIELKQVCQQLRELADIFVAHELER